MDWNAGSPRTASCDGRGASHEEAGTSTCNEARSSRTPSRPAVHFGGDDPLAAAHLTGLESATGVQELGTALGLTAASLLFLQFLSSGRYESLSGRIGIARTKGFHRIAAYVLLLFALLHPLAYLAATAMIDPSAGLPRRTAC